MRTNELASTVNTSTVERKIRGAARDLGYRGDTVFEHGHWWLMLRDGSIFDVVDAIGPGSSRGFGFERVSGPED